jgi:hypothetical protein
VLLQAGQITGRGRAASQRFSVWWKRSILPLGLGVIEAHGAPATTLTDKGMEASAPRGAAWSRPEPNPGN